MRVVGLWLSFVIVSFALPVCAQEEVAPAEVARAEAGEPSFAEPPDGYGASLFDRLPAAERLELRLALADVERRNDVATSLWISSFVMLGGAVGGTVGGIAALISGVHDSGQSSGGAALLGLSLASFVGHIVTMVFAASYGGGARSRHRTVMRRVLGASAAPRVDLDVSPETLRVGVSVAF